MVLVARCHRNGTAIVHQLRAMAACQRKPSSGYHCQFVAALVMRILETAALQQERVLREPAPNAALSAFGVDGLEFTVGYWMGDPQNGQLNLRSHVLPPGRPKAKCAPSGGSDGHEVPSVGAHVTILKALRENGIRIPPPQRAAEPVTAPVEAAQSSL